MQDLNRPSNENTPLKDNEKPCLVETGRGFSVSYKNKLLYSKYSPEKTIEQIVSSLNILSGTLFIVFSPALFYGLDSLLKKLPENCFILAIEKEKALYEFSKEILKTIKEKNPLAKEKVCLLSPEKIPDIVNIILGKDKDTKNIIPEIYNFKRTQYIEFSGGSGFNKELYNNIASACQNAVASFWKNRLTLTRFGRLYTRNIFKNSARLKDSISFSSLKNTVTKPILICGTGESTETTLKTLSKAELAKCFIICLDATLPVFRALNIKPDCAVAVESQLAIEKAYIGSKKLNTLLFADITSRPSVTRHAQNGICFFASDFTDSAFIEDLKKSGIYPETVPALGSVGLTAAYIALLLRKSSEVPVFTAGLDFNFSLGKTHANGAPAHLTRLTKSNRFTSIENYDASFKPGAKKAFNIEEKDYFTDIALSSYAESFKDTFAGKKNLFNLSKTGLNLNLPVIENETLQAYLKNLPSDTKENARLKTKEDTALKQKIITYLKNEKTALKKIRTMLTKGRAGNETEEQFQNELEKLITGREYLFLHFPDGYKCRAKDIDFLKRIRSELDFFIKDIELALEEINTKQCS